MRAKSSEIRSSSYQDVDDKFALVDVVVSSGAFVYRDQLNPLTGKVEPFMRGLEVSEDAIRLDRLKLGAPVLNNHKDDEDIRDVVGSVDDCWIEKSPTGMPLLMATLKLSKVSDMEREIAEKVKGGIIRAVSVGAEIHKEVDITSKNDDITRIIATDWEPYEISLVPIPADSHSIIRSKGGKVPRKGRKKLSRNVDSATVAEVVGESLDGVIEDEIIEEVAEEVAAEASDIVENLTDAEVEEMAEEVAKEEMMGESDKEEMMGTADKENMEGEADKEEMGGESDKEEMMGEADQEEMMGEAEKELMAEDAEKEQLRKILKKIALRKALARRIGSWRSKRGYTAPVRSRRSATRRVQVDESHKVRYAQQTRSKIKRAITAKITNNFGKDNLSSNEFRNMSLIDMAKEALYREGNHEARNWLPQEVYDNVIGSRRFERRSSAGPFAVSSDFANLFTDSVNKAVQQSYEFQRGKQTFDKFVTRTNVKDFKNQERVSLGEFGKLQEVQPGADAPITPISDDKEEYRLKTYSNTFQITRQGFIDDDTGELNQVLTSGMSAADIESDLVYAEFTNGQVKGQPWARAANKNLTTGAALNASTDPYKGIKAIYEGLAKQTGLDVDTPLNLQFKHLLVPTALYFEALQTQGVAYPANPQFPNPYQDLYEITHEPRLDVDSATSYYGIAAEAGSFRSFIELAFLKGQSTPIMKFEESFSNDVLSWKLTHDCAAKILDYRLAHKVTA